MPKSKSKSNVRAAFSGGLPKHPAVRSPHPLVGIMLGTHKGEVRYPDHQNQATAATVLKHEYTLSSDAAGYIVSGVSPTMTSSRLDFSVAAGITAAVETITPHSQATSFNAEARVARLVAVHVKYVYIGREDESSGFISGARYNSVLDVRSRAVDEIHTGADHTCRATEGLEMYGLATQDPRWETPTAGTFMGTTYDNMMFVANGLPFSKPLFRVTVTKWMEYQPIEGTLSEFSLNIEPHDPGALAAVGALSAGSLATHPASGKESFLKRAEGVANAAYHIAQPLLTNYVVPKARDYLISQAEARLPLLLGM